MAVYDPRGGGGAHVDQMLTALSVGYQNLGLVGSALFPPVTVKKQSDKYYVFGQELFTLDPSGDLRAPGTVANEIPGLKLSTDQYFAKEHALQIAIPDEERENADAPLSPDRDGTELVTGKLMLGREVAMQTLVTTAANYPAGNTVTLSGTAQWNDYTNSDPIANIRTGVRAINAKLFMDPNTIVIPYEVMSQLMDHPDFIERIKYSERGIVTADLIAAVIGLPNVITPGLGFSATNPGQTLSVGYLWGKDVLLAYVPPRPGMRVPAFAYEYVWGYGAQPMVTERWREDNRVSDVLRVRRRYDLKLTAKDANGKAIAGYLIKAAVA
jgi:hypothetical protein